MKFHQIFLIIFLVSCKTKQNDIAECNSSIKDVNFYEIIELITEDHSAIERETYPIVVKYLDTIAVVENLDYVFNKLTLNSQKKLLNQLKTRKESFRFNADSLTPKTKELAFIENQSGDIIIYGFNSFIVNDSKDSLAYSVSVAYTNKLKGGHHGGWEEIIFLSRTNSKWKIDKRVEFISY